MSETILVSHPAPVRHVPKGSRNERLSFARIETPAVLNTVDPDAFALPRGPDGSEIHGSLRIRDGKFWALLGMGDAESRVAIRPEAFKAFLRGELSGATSDVEILTKRFRQTNLVACHSVTVRLDKTETRLETGEGIDVDASRSIAHDGREACARATAAWLADEVAVVGNEIMTRVRPLVRYRHDGTRHDLTILPEPLAFPGAIPHFGFDGFDEGIATYRNDWDREPKPSKQLRDILAGMPGGMGAEYDIAYLANLFVEDIFRIRKTHFGFLHGAEEIAAVQKKLLPARYAAMTGRLGAAEAPEVLRLVRRAAGVCVERNPDNMSSWSLKRACRYLDAAILPRFEQVPDADADAMAGLAR